jgi:hypothetical protein
MLSPDARAVAMDLLKPPANYRLDRTVLTTFSLDLEVLLTLPLAVLAHAEGGVEELLEDPLLLLEALREAGERVQVFVDEGGIAIPGNSRALYAALESSVHPVRAGNGGAFHPKVWVARFVAEGRAPLLRVSVGSRNLTHDRSWDLALATEAEPGRKKVPESAALAGLLRALPGLMAESGREVSGTDIEALAREVGRTAFPAPEGFASPVAFHALGLGKPGGSWQPVAEADRVLAMAPFVNRTALDSLAGIGATETVLVSRQDSLDALPDDALEGWPEKLVLSQAAEGEPEDATASRPSGLHAKALVFEKGREVSWFVGSANLTAAAFTGTNVEMMASVTGRHRPGKQEVDIRAFREAGFQNLCEPWRRLESPERDDQLEAAQSRLEEARRALLQAGLNIACEPSGEEWCWRLEGQVKLPPGVDVHVWPVSLDEDRAAELALPMERVLPASRLAAIVAFRLSVPESVDDVRFALKLPARGIPDSRVHQILRTLIDSPERFLQFLRALLGGVEALADWASDTGGTGWDLMPGAGLSGEPLLEDLLRAASRDPARLAPIRRLIEDLRKTEEGRRIVPEDLYALWQVVDSTLGQGRSA